MTLTPAETCRKVADIIDCEQERFDMRFFQEESECGTVACIAGHAALLHGDGMNTAAEDGTVVADGNGHYSFLPSDEWIYRQGFRLGLTEFTAWRLFCSAEHPWLSENAAENPRRYSLVLRQLAEELAGREEGNLIDIVELDLIAAESLA